MEFRLLGPVEVWHTGRRLDIGPRQRRLILASLLMDAGRMVTIDTLIDRVWEDAASGQVRQTLYAHIARIRQLLKQQHAAGEHELVREGGGYRLNVNLASVDLHRFRQLVATAREQRHSDTQRLAMLRDALSMWHGTPLAGLAGSWADRVREALGQQRMNAVLDWAKLELSAGDPDSVVAELASLAVQFPLVEPLAVQLMRALHAGGRTAEALAHFAAVRAALAEEFGVDPGPELRGLHQALLRGDVAEQAEQPPDTAESRAWEAPAQMPMDIMGFVGRTGELGRLDQAVTDTARRPSTVVISAMVGTAGVGKTALAVRWARHVAHHFPDGQLFVNLHGFDTEGPAVSPEEALRGFLDAFGVPPQRVPLTLQAQTALYRSILHGRRVLVVLDNARDVDQVRPLLPGSPGCQVVVTSRRRMTSLVASEGARLITLDVLSRAEARELLVNRIGAARTKGAQEALEEIIRLCARLPLALTLVAARAVANPSWRLETIAHELRDDRSRLDTLADGDDSADLRATFSWSYRRLTDAAARMFRLLGLHPGPGISLPAAASLAGIPIPQARRALTELTNAHMISQSEQGEFSFHDLLRAYAADLAAATDTDSDRRSALTRIYDHYLHTAYRADQLLYPLRDQVALPAHDPDVVPQTLTDDRHASQWFRAEHPALMALVTAAERLGLDWHAAHLVWTMVTFLDRQGRAQDLLATQTIALNAVGRLGDRQWEGQVHRDLGFAHSRLGQYAEAYRHYEQAMVLFTESADRASLARVHRDMAFILWRQGGSREQATAHLAEALALSDTAGHRAGKVYASNLTGILHYARGDYAAALEVLWPVVRQYQELRDRVGEAVTWEGLGHTYRELKNHVEADTCYRRAIDLRRSLDDHYLEAYTLDYIAANYLDADDAGAASRAWQAAAEIFEKMGHPDGPRIRAKLKGIASKPDKL